MKKRVSNLQIFASFLFTLVLFHGQAMALVGGPVYPINENSGGLYSGVMVQTYSTIDGESDSNDFDITSLSTSSGSIALFSLTQPQTGIGEGEIIIFDEGRVYRGSLSSAASPSGGDLKGIIEASFDYTLTIVLMDGPESIDVTATVNGTFFLNVAGNNMFNSDTLTVAGEAELLRSNGGVDTSTGDVIVDEKIIYAIDGYKQ